MNTQPQPPSIATRIIVLDRLIHKSADMEMYSITKMYCDDIIKSIKILESEIDDLTGGI